MTQTFYDVLGVASDATTEEIETAYRNAIKEVHPDVSDDVDASDRAARLNKAKDILTDEAERARYDRLGHDSYVSAASASGTGPASRSNGTGDGETVGSRRRRDGSDRRDHSPGGRTRDERSRRGPEERTGSDIEEERAGRGPTDDPWRSGEGPSGSPSARRQAAASATPGPNVDDSWNAWDRTRAWAVHQDTGTRTGVHPSRFFPPEQSLFLLASTFLLYPLFVFSVAFPAFPLLARLVVAACTVSMIVYLLSLPEVAMLVFGLWSLLFPLAVLVLPGASLLSLVGVVGMVSTWVPLGFAVFTLAMLRPG